VRRYLASLPGTPRRDEPSASARRLKRGIARVHFSERPGRESEVVLQFHGAAQASAESRVELAALAQLLQQRLVAALRVKLGAVYDVAVEHGWVAGGAFVKVHFTCAPDHVERLLKGSLEVVSELKARAISDGEAELLRARRREELERDLVSKSFWVRELAQAYLTGHDPRRILELARLTSRIDPEHLRSAARRYLRDDQYLEAVWAASPEPPSVAR
jgi:zinc protease